MTSAFTTIQEAIAAGSSTIETVVKDNWGQLLGPDEKRLVQAMLTGFKAGRVTNVGRAIQSAETTSELIRATRVGVKVVSSPGWVTGTMSGAGLTFSAMVSQNAFVIKATAATTGKGRLNSFNTAQTHAYSLFPGTITQVNWGCPFMVEFFAGVATGGLGGIARILIGHTSGAVADLESKGFGIDFIGGSGGVQTVGLTMWNTSKVLGGTSNQSTTSTAEVAYQFVWLPGKGAFLYANGELVSQITVGLITGLGSAGYANLQFVAENVSTNAGAVSLSVSPPVITHLNIPLNS